MRVVMLAICICQREALKWKACKWKGESFDFVRKKKSYAGVAKIHSKKESSICKNVKEKEIHASFAIAPQTAKVAATVSDKCVVKMEKVLNLYNILREEREAIFTYFLLQYIFIIIVLCYYYCC